MNIMVKIYARSVKRGTRTLEQVPEEFREQVAAMLAEDAEQ